MNYLPRLQDKIRKGLSPGFKSLCKHRNLMRPLASIMTLLPGQGKRLRLARQKCLEIGHKWEILQIGLTDNCNLLCRHCIRTKRYVSPPLSLRSFAFLLANFQPDCFDRLLISDWGEIFTIPHIVQYLRHAKKAGWQIEVVTNGTLLNEQKIDVILRENLLLHMMISLESAVPTHYEHIRGMAWDKFRRNLAVLKLKNEEYGFPLHISFAVCCFRYNLGDLHTIVDLAAEFNVSPIIFAHLIPCPHLPYGTGLADQPQRRDVNSCHEKLYRADQHLDSEDRNRVLEKFSEVLRKASDRGVKIILPEDYPELKKLSDLVSPEITKKPEVTSGNNEFACPWARRWIQVSQEGEIFLCCQMMKKYSFGNIYFTPFYKIWDSPQTRYFLDGLRSGNKPHPVCRNCNAYKGKRF